MLGILIVISIIFFGPRLIFVGPLVPSFKEESAHEFQSEGGFIVTSHTMIPRTISGWQDWCNSTAGIISFESYLKACEYCINFPKNTRF